MPREMMAGDLRIIGGVRDSDGDLCSAVAHFEMTIPWTPLALTDKKQQLGVSLRGAFPEQVFEWQFDHPNGVCRKVVMPDIDALLSLTRRHWFMLGAVATLLAASVLAAVIRLFG